MRKEKAVRKGRKNERRDKSESVATASEVVGAAVGALIGGPAGSVAGYAIGRVGRDFLSRHLSNREQGRIAEVLKLAADEIATRVSAGEAIRTDGIFQDGKPPSKGMELAEAVLGKAQREPDSEKLPYLARLLANIAFDASISPLYAHQLLKHAEELTFRQFVLMKLCVTKDKYELRTTDFAGPEEIESPLIEETLRELLDLCDRGFVGVGNEHMIDTGWIAPSRMQLRPFGVRAYQALGLTGVPEQQVASVAAPLKA